MLILVRETQDLFNIVLQVHHKVCLNKEFFFNIGRLRLKLGNKARIHRGIFMNML